MTDLTIVCWLWDGWRPNSYKPEHVLALREMVRKHMSMPHRFVCVTDQLDALAGKVETIPIWTEPDIHTGTNRPNCYRRLRMFSREAPSMFGPRVLSLDLDCVVLGDLAPLIPDTDFKAMEGKAAPYNGSMLFVRTGKNTRIWETLTKHAPDQIRRHQTVTKIRHYGSDQAWLSMHLPNRPTWGPKDGAYHYTLLDGAVPDDARVVFFAGSVKPWSPRLAQEYPRLADAYREAHVNTLSV